MRHCQQNIDGVSVSGANTFVILMLVAPALIKRRMIDHHDMEGANNEYYLVTGREVINASNMGVAILKYKCFDLTRAVQR